jgi:hypothetical protein
VLHVIGSFFIIKKNAVKNNYSIHRVKWGQEKKLGARYLLRLLPGEGSMIQL